MGAAAGPRNAGRYQRTGQNESRIR